MWGYLPDLLGLPDLPNPPYLPIPRRVARFPVGSSEGSAQPRKRQRRAAGFAVWGWHDFGLSESPNNRARIFGTISNFPSFLTCSCELFGQEIELSESDNIESSGSRLGKFNFLPFSASPMYLPPESSVSCHLHETAGALRRPRVLTLRFRAHTKNAGVLPRSRSRARTQNAGAPPTHCARALSQNEGGTGFVPRPAFLRPDVSTGCLCGRACCRLVFGCRSRLLVAAGIRLLVVLPALRPIGDGASSWSASAVPPARSLRAACRRGPAARRLTVGCATWGRATNRKQPTCE